MHRLSLAFVFVMAAACSSTGGDSTPDEAAYRDTDLASFRYQWSGNGQSGSFDLNQDCRLTSSGTLAYGGGAVPTGSGVVSAADCTAFKKLAVSPEVVTAFDRYTTSNPCAPISDDYTTASLAMTSGAKHSMTWVLGCSDLAPFKKLRVEMARLANKYVVASTDAGTD